MAWQGDSKRRTFFYIAVSNLHLHPLSEPLVWRSLGAMFLEWVSHVMVFFRLSGIPCTGALHPCASQVEPFAPFYRGTHLNDCGGDTYHKLFLRTGNSGSGSFYTRHWNRMGLLHNKLRASYRRNFLDVYLHRNGAMPTDYYRNLQTQLWHVSHAHFLAFPMGYHFQARAGVAHCRRYPCHSHLHLYLLLVVNETYFVYPRKQVAYRIIVCLVRHKTYNGWWLRKNDVHPKGKKGLLSLLHPRLF